MDAVANLAVIVFSGIFLSILYGEYKKFKGGK